MSVPSTVTDGPSLTEGSQRLTRSPTLSVLRIDTVDCFGGIKGLCRPALASRPFLFASTPPLLFLPLPNTKTHRIRAKASRNRERDSRNRLLVLPSSISSPDLKDLVKVLFISPRFWISQCTRFCIDSFEVDAYLGVL